jgi:outer membrane receptor protein involved in Fe transport
MMHSRSWRLSVEPILLGFALAIAQLGAVHAGEVTQHTLPPVFVTGERISSYHAFPRTEVTADPAALPAFTTILDTSYIERTPITSYGDALRPITGVNINNYGQGGVGYGIALRGFTDADHGRDVAYFIDGVPINEVSSVHTQHYADLNPLIPETIERVEIIRGPFSAEYGDAALGGVVNIMTKRAEPFASGKVSGGSFATGRGLLTYSQTHPIGGWLAPYLAWEGYTTDGYRDNQEFRRYNLFNKVSLALGNGTLSTRVQVYGGDWGAPGYLPRQSVQAGMASPKAATNQTDGGRKELQNLVFNYQRSDPDRDWKATGFVSHDTFLRFADFGGGQRAQDEERLTLGLTLRKVWTGRLFASLPVQLMVGTNWRNDIVDLSQEPTIDRNPSGSRTLDLSFNEHGLGVFTQAQVRPLTWLKLTAGARYDHFWFDIDDALAANPVRNSDSGVWSPKAGVAIVPLTWLEIFANYGEGFRSPSAVSELLANPGLEPAKLRSFEVGVQLQPIPRIHFLADLFTTTLDREVFQPVPELPPQNIGRSRREGFEVEGRYYVLQRPHQAVALFANYTQVRARLLDRGASTVVPNVPKSILNIGFDFDIPIAGEHSPHRLLGLAYMQFIGRKNLTEDGRLTTEPYERIAARLEYAHRSGWAGFLDVTWYPSDRLSETAFNFGNAIGASPADIFVSPQAPVTVIGGITYRFRTGG